MPGRRGQNVAVSLQRDSSMTHRVEVRGAWPHTRRHRSCRRRSPREQRVLRVHELELSTPSDRHSFDDEPSTERNATDRPAAGPHRDGRTGVIGDRNRECRQPGRGAGAHPGDLTADPDQAARWSVGDGNDRRVGRRDRVGPGLATAQEAHRQPTRTRRTSSSASPVTSTRTSSFERSTVSPRGTTT